MIDCVVVELSREEDDATEVDGEPVATGPVCDTAAGGHLRGKLGGWLGLHGPHEVSTLIHLVVITVKSFHLIVMYTQPLALYYCEIISLHWHKIWWFDDNRYVGGHLNLWISNYTPYYSSEYIFFGIFNSWIALSTYYIVLYVLQIDMISR